MNDGTDRATRPAAAGNPYPPKPVVFFRRKWTRVFDDWIEVPVWLVRHTDGRREEKGSFEAAFAAAHSQAQQDGWLAYARAN